MSKGINEEDVIVRYRKGESPYQIAKDLQTYANKIRRILKKRGVTLRNKKEAQTNALKTGASKHPTEGKTRTAEEKLAISSGMQTYWEGMDDDERDRRAKIAKDRWDNMSRKEIAEAPIRAIKGSKTS